MKLFLRTKSFDFLLDLYYLRHAVRGAKQTCFAEITPYEPDMYNNSAGKRYLF
jgi:hypothetical protein